MPLTLLSVGVTGQLLLCTLHLTPFLHLFVPGIPLHHTLYDHLHLYLAHLHLLLHPYHPVQLPRRRRGMTGLALVGLLLSSNANRAAGVKWTRPPSLYCSSTAGAASTATLFLSAN